METGRHAELFKNNLNHKRVLVTGANGFVSGHLIPLLLESGASVIGSDLSNDKISQKIEFESCDLRDLFAVKNLVHQARPEFVIHLASQSSVGTSWSSEWETIESNVQATHNLMNSLEQLGKPIKALVVSTGEVYGNLPHSAKVTDPLKPLSPYAVSKSMMEMLLHRFTNSNVRFVIARSFNHTGPGRPARFFEASVAQQFAEARKSGKKTVVLKVGNLDVIRDFSDVREVAKKYLYLLSVGEHTQAYNVCSGIGLSLNKIIEILEIETEIKATIEVDQARLRKNDIPKLVGENSLKEIFPSDPRSIHSTLKVLFQSFSQS